MPTIDKSYTVTQRGLGAPDYSNTVSSAKERAGIRLTQNQGLQIFGAVFSGIASPYPWVLPNLAIGGTVSLVDNLTGLALPYNVPIGYTLSIVSIGVTTDQDIVVYAYFDTFLVLCLGVYHGASSGYENQVVGMTTSTIDPDALAAHAIDIQVTNLGLAVMTGAVDIKLILEAVGTPPFPTTKVIKCRVCGYESTVPMTETRLVCPKCSNLTLVYGYQDFKESA